MNISVDTRLTQYLNLYNLAIDICGENYELGSKGFSAVQKGDFQETACTCPKDKLDGSWLSVDQSLSQDLETGCPKLAILKFWGVLFFKGFHNILRLKPRTCIHLLKYGIISFYNVMGTKKMWTKFNYML